MHVVWEIICREAFYKGAPSCHEDDEEESVPGFLAVFSTIALVGAAFVASRRNE